MLCDSNVCTNCGVCYCKCPVGAIEIIQDQFGFNKPQINEKKCVQCGICKQVCDKTTSLQPYVCENEKQPKVFAAISRQDEVLKTSASGGLAYILGRYFINTGGYVCGTKWNDDFSVKFSITNKVSELKYFQGSKYVESEVGVIYKDVEALLKKDEKVLFVGLPCQVSGLLRYLGKKYEQLYLVDLLCSGISSSGLFDKYLKFTAKELGSNVWEIGQRDKTSGDSQLCQLKPIHIALEDGRHFYRDGFEDSFYSWFLSGLSIRSSCNNCRYASLPRCGDITLGDFDMLKAINKIYRKKQTICHDGCASSVLINNERGYNLFKSITSELLCEEHRLEELTLINPRVCMPKSKENPNYNTFWTDYLYLDYQELINKYFIYNKWKRFIINIIKKIGGNTLINIVAQYRMHKLVNLQLLKTQKGTKNE